jgi:hypothetical protein
MRGSEPHAEEIAKRSSRSTQRWFLRYRTKMFRMKHFGTIDGLAKHTFGA